MNEGLLDSFTHAVGSVLLWGEYNSRELLTAKTAITLELTQKERLGLVFAGQSGKQEITKEKIYSDRGLKNTIYFNYIKKNFIK